MRSEPGREPGLERVLAALCPRRRASRRAREDRSRAPASRARATARVRASTAGSRVRASECRRAWPRRSRTHRRCAAARRAARAHRARARVAPRPRPASDPRRRSRSRRSPRRSARSSSRRVERRRELDPGFAIARIERGDDDEFRSRERGRVAELRAAAAAQQVAAAGRPPVPARCGPGRRTQAAARSPAPRRVRWPGSRRDRDVRPSCRSICCATRLTRRIAPVSTSKCAGAGRPRRTSMRWNRSGSRNPGAARSGSRSDSSAATWHASSRVPEGPGRAAPCARGAGGRPALPCRGRAAVTRPPASTASSRSSRSRACASVAGRRRVEPGERRGIGASPARELERQRREVGLEDFGGRLRQQRVVRRLAPEPVADAGRGAARAAAALLGRRAGDARRSRGGSCRSTGRSAGVARGPRPRRCARRRSSGWSRRCWSRPRPCGARAGPAAARRPVPRRRGRRTAAAPRIRPRAGCPRGPPRRGGSRRRPGGRRARRRGDRASARSVTEVTGPSMRGLSGRAPGRAARRSARPRETCRPCERTTGGVRRGRAAAPRPRASRT